MIIIICNYHNFIFPRYQINLFYINIESLVENKIRMSRLNRSKKINKLVVNKFINIYFDDDYPNDDYDIYIQDSKPFMINIIHKTKKWNWILYSTQKYYNLLNDIKIHLAAYRIQQWWKKRFYDPKLPFIHKFMNKKYDEYVSIV